MQRSLIRNLISSIQISDFHLDSRYIGEMIFENNKFNLPQNFLALWCRLDETEQHYQHIIDELEIYVERNEYKKRIQGIYKKHGVNAVIKQEAKTIDKIIKCYIPVIQHTSG